ncbi:hypothetical protein BTHE_2002 [Bifidobacterium thermophilum]|nr:hypothetical protein BTHE_2002 [Bifidobacterium thermophilum]
MRRSGVSFSDRSAKNLVSGSQDHGSRYTGTRADVRCIHPRTLPRANHARSRQRDDHRLHALRAVRPMEAQAPWHANPFVSSRKRENRRTQHTKNEREAEQ